jgi:y4mF family transcriptional regulator
MVIPYQTIKEIGLLVKEKRKKLLLTQKEVAGLCNTGVRFLSDLENGKPTLEIEKVLNVIRALGLQVNISNRVSS